MSLPAGRVEAREVPRARARAAVDDERERAAGDGDGGGPAIERDAAVHKARELTFAACMGYQLERGPDGCSGPGSTVVVGVALADENAVLRDAGEGVSGQ